MIMNVHFSIQRPTRINNHLDFKPIIKDRKACGSDAVYLARCVSHLFENKSSIDRNPTEAAIQRRIEKLSCKFQLHYNIMAF